MPSPRSTRLRRLQKRLLDTRPVYPDLEQVTLGFWLSKVREYLTADDANTKLLLGRDSPETLAAALARSRLGDPAVRKALWDGGMKAVLASDDPMIRFMLKIDPAARQIRSQYDEQVNGPTTQAAEKIARARFVAVGALAAWTVAVWVVRDIRIVAADHDVGFTVVHVVLGVVSIVLAAWAWREATRTARRPVPV